MLPTVSIVVPAKNEEKVIENCIKSLVNLDYPKDKLQIVTVIDKSEDKTLEICKKFKNRIKIIQPNPPCRNKAEAIDRAIPYLKGEIIGLFDADCVVDKHCLKEVIKNFSDEKIAAVNGALLSSNKKQNLITRALSIETCLISYTEYFFNRYVSKNSVFLGRNMFIRKNIFVSVGGFDATEFSEDNELALRLKGMGYRIVFEHKAIAWNEENSTLRSFVKQRIRWYRAFIKTLRKKPYKSLKDHAYDLFHRIYFHIAPLVIAILLFYSIFSWLSIPLILLTPLIILFLFCMFMVVRSKMFYKEPLSDLIYFPVFFILNFIQTLLYFKAVYDEKEKRKLLWTHERSGIIKK
jgi:cellulose synthase/poly-beta-1,6-N-acetylglucosamine synthase-like glycosyltransferase